MLSAILADRDISSPAELERADFFGVDYDKMHTKKNRLAPIRPDMRYFGLLKFVSCAPTKAYNYVHYPTVSCTVSPSSRLSITVFLRKASFTAHISKSR